MNLRFYLVALTALVFLTGSCSLLGEGPGQQTITLNDQASTSEGDEIVITDADLEGQTGGSISKVKESSQGVTQVLNDNSRVTVLIDGHGNRTETRMFMNDPLLQMVMMRTFVDGRKEAFVYGHHGQVEQLPEDLAANALSASGSELAYAVGIFKPKPIQFKPISRPASTPLRPLPSSEFPVQEPNPPPSETKETIAGPNTSSGPSVSVEASPQPEP